MPRNSICTCNRHLVWWASIISVTYCSSLMERITQYGDWLFSRKVKALEPWFKILPTRRVQIAHRWKTFYIHVEFNVCPILFIALLWCLHYPVKKNNHATATKHKTPHKHIQKTQTNTKHHCSVLVNYIVWLLYKEELFITMTSQWAR